MKLEVIVFDKESMIAAQDGGATQVELVRDLDKNGLSPKIQTIKEVMEVAKIPVHVMVRHSDTFQHTDEELDEMAEYVVEIKKLGISGVVFGSLDKDNKINTNHLKKIKEICEPEIKFIHHRAADFARCNLEAYGTLMENKVKHILTSGGPNKAIDNLNVITIVSEYIDDVLIGSGVSKENVEQIVKETGIKQLHVGSAVWSSKEKIDENKVREIRELLDSL